jgi:hypothetical protein
MNLLEAVTPKLLAQGLMALRTTCVMPRLVNRDYDTIAQQRGATVNVPIPSAIPVSDVNPAPNAPNTDTIEPESVPIPLDQWKEAPFYLTDKDMKQAMDGTIPMQASEAVSGLADVVDTFILNQYKDVFALVGTPGTTPFSNGRTTDANQASMVLNQMKAPKPNRRVVIDPLAEASALELRAFQDVSFNGEMFGIKEGEINRKLGFDWFMDQNIPYHTTAASLSDWTVDGAVSAGDKEFNVTGGANAPGVGDIFTVAGNTQTHVVKSYDGAKVTFAPALPADVADTSQLTFMASHAVNLAFHRDAIAFATRPLGDEGTGLGNIINSQVDPVSGLALRLEISREHKRVRFSYDILYGGAVVRPQLIARLAG